MLLIKYWYFLELVLYMNMNTAMFFLAVMYVHSQKFHCCQERNTLQDDAGLAWNKSTTFRNIFVKKNPKKAKQKKPTEFKKSVL